MLQRAVYMGELVDGQSVLEFLMDKVPVPSNSTLPRHLAWPEFNAYRYRLIVVKPTLPL